MCTSVDIANVLFSVHFVKASIALLEYDQFVFVNLHSQACFAVLLVVVNECLLD